MSPPPRSKDPSSGEGPSVLLRTIDPEKEYPGSGMPANTGMLLTGHVVLKTVEAGAIVGLATSPIGYFFSKDKNKSLLRNAFRYPGRGTLIGIPLGLFMVAGKSYSMDGPGVDDRAYRIMHNEGQQRTDRFATYGAIGGAVAGAVGVLVPGAGLTRIWNTSSVGVALGVLVHVATMGPGDGSTSVQQKVKDAADKMK
ncbi:hypothetical protein DFJ74DRAFT_60704 [Hyaloraphidium curvatum]|nr:hypothetical protein DFJ74DRAFT_60704 [Hyaloraphidium curvatum]